MMKTKPSSIKRRDSRYVQGGVSDVHEKSIAWWERDATLKPAADDGIIENLPAVYNGRPDLLSYALYGNNNLEWVILQLNNIVDVNEEFVTGATIRVPSDTRMFSSILTKSTSGS